MLAASWTRRLLTLLTFTLGAVGTVAAYTKSDCYFPFLYNGTEFYYCTRNAYYTLWCSLDRVYTGRWTVCGPEVPKEILDSIKTTMDEVGKEKAKLALEEAAIASVAKSMKLMANATETAKLNRSAIITELDRKLEGLSRTLKELELHQRSLDRRESNQESLQPLEIGMMAALTAAVTGMAVALFALHCHSSKRAHGSGEGGEAAAPAALLAPQQLGSLAVHRVQPVPQSAASGQIPDAKKFPGHFYRLTIDEEPAGEQDDGEDEEAGDEELEEEDEEEDDGQHSRAAAALASGPSEQQQQPQQQQQQPQGSQSSAAGGSRRPSLISRR